MIRYLFATGILTAITIFPSHGQGTLVILLDVFQNPTEEDAALYTQMTEEAQQIVGAHNGRVFSHYCDPFNSDYQAIGREGVMEQLDSVSSGKISPPQMQTNWQQMGLGVIEALIRQEKRLDMGAVTIHLMTASINSSDFESNLVSPFAHVFDFLDDTGAFSPNFSVFVHSYSPGQASPKVDHITSLK